MRFRVLLVVICLLSFGWIASVLGSGPSRALPSATLDPPFTATGIDADSPADGQFDYLIVEVTVNATSPGGFLLLVRTGYTSLGGRGFRFRLTAASFAGCGRTGRTC